MPRRLTTTKVAVPQRWEVFAEEFLVDLNATRAAERAGYSKKGAEQAASKETLILVGEVD